MLSKYFEIKTKEQSFIDNLRSTINELKGKKVIIYGAGQGFEELNKTYKFNEELNIVAIADKKFEKKPCDKFCGIKAICPKNIPDEDFDYILVTNERAKGIAKYLEYDLEITENKIKTVFVEEIKDECDNLNYLYKFNFDKTLPKLIKKLQNKTVVLYGAGAFLEIIKKTFDISGLNIIGVADRRFEGQEEKTDFLGYKTFAPSQVKEINPDYVLVATKFYISIIEELYYDTFQDTKIKVKPLFKKDFLTLVKEIWK